jgi:hypothetical protein
VKVILRCLAENLSGWTGRFSRRQRRGCMKGADKRQILCKWAVPVGLSGWEILDALISLQVPLHVDSLSFAVH